MLDFLLGPPRRANSDQGWTTSGISLGQTKTRAGVTVDGEASLTYAAVWCATRIIAETAASLPLLTYRRMKDDGREQAVDHPNYDLLKAAPNPEMGSMVFREGRIENQVNAGNGFAEIEKDRAGQAKALWPIHASRVRPSRKEDRDVALYPYRVRNNDGSEIPLRADEMLHIPGALSSDGIWGKGVIAYAREAIGFGLATERHGAAYFGSGAQPKGFLKLPGVRTREARAEFRAEWKEVHNSPDASEIVILPVEGAEYSPISISNEDSQFLGTRQHNVSEIARFYRIPPHMLFDLTRSTNNNIEFQGMEFVVYSLMPWLRRWEEQINLKLFTPEERKEFYVEHLLAALLRGDLLSRYNAYQVGLANGILSVNDVLRAENMNPVGPEGDKHFFQLNMTTLEKVGEEPPAPAPFGGGGGGTVEPEEESPDAEQAAALRDSARRVLVDVLGRMFTKEANAAQRAADGPDFDAWLATFYAKHLDTLTAALAPVVSVMGLAGVKGTASELAGRLVEDSQAELHQSYDTETKVQFKARLAAWPTERAQKWADFLFNDDQPREPDGKFGTGGGDSGGNDAQDARDSAREKEDEATQDSRTQEDDDRFDQRSQEDETTYEERQGEDEEVQGARDKEDRKTEKGREKEDRLTEKVERKEDRLTEKQDEKEDTKAEREADKAQEERDAGREQADEQDRQERAAEDTARHEQETKEKDDMIARHEQEREKEGDGDAVRDRQKAEADVLLDRHSAEENSVEATRDDEDAATGERREKEDEEHQTRAEIATQARETARQEESEQRERAREAASDHRQAEREKADEAREAKREAEDEHREAERNRKDEERQGQRDKADEDKDKGRDEEDKATQQRRDKEDSGHQATARPADRMLAAG